MADHVHEDLERRLGRIEETFVSQRYLDAKFEGVRSEIQGVREDVSEVKEEQRTHRNLLRSVLLTSGGSLFVMIVGAMVLYILQLR